MTLFWGDINFPTSRAIDEDEDESDEEKDEMPVKMNQAKEILFFVGPNAKTFCQAFILENNSNDLIGTIESMEKIHAERDVELSPKGKVNIYQLNNNMKSVLFLIDIILAPEFLHDYTTYIFNLFTKLPKVYIFFTSHITNLKTEQHLLNNPCLRYLTTNPNKTLNMQLQPLEQPNIVSGLPAAILSYCQVNGLIATIFLSYVESVTLDIVATKSFLNLFHCMFTNIKVSNDCKFNKILEDLIKAKSNSTLFT